MSEPGNSENERLSAGLAQLWYFHLKIIFEKFAKKLCFVKIWATISWLKNFSRIHTHTYIKENKFNFYCNEEKIGLGKQ